MNPDSAQLSALAASLDQITERLEGIAQDRRAQRADDPVAGELEEIERSLRSAVRRLERLLRQT